MSKTRIAVAMSGGVDSSVTALFLKEKGYEVIGLTMHLTSSTPSRCCSPQDIQDARNVASRLQIPHYVVSFEEIFRNEVIEYFISEYERGRTPNPCAVCNFKIKFDALLKKALDLGAERLATGHYAVISQDKSTGRFMLRRGKEKGKDQSYFLARLTQEQLSRAWFPIGNFPKAKIRKIAEKFGLPVAFKPESQEACFLTEEGVIPFIERARGHSYPPGPFMNREGQCVGFHRGIIGYTIGQRKGLGISLGKPVYVTRIDPEKNVVFIGDEEELYHTTFWGIEPHWISIEGISKPEKFQVRIRYKHRPAFALVIPEGDQVLVRFEKPQRAITPGQLAVFYKNDFVAGSAWIDQIVE